MPHLKWSDRAGADLARLYDFLEEKSPSAAERAIAKIEKAADGLEAFPQSGRLVVDEGVELRKLPVPFSSSGYLIFYRIDGDTVTILWLDHMREQPNQNP